MIFRLEYKNKALKTARVDIITPTGTGVETVEGTGYPFMLKYEGDKKNKGLMFLSSSAEINIYETPLFNIDTLKTSGEKDIRVNYYIDSVLEWTGFVIPDFFSREIGGDGVVSMVASDRLSVLDSEVLEGLPVTVTLRTLLSLSLAKTGLNLPLKTVADFAISGTAQRVLDYQIRSQRLTDTKGRSVNCKDIIKSILVATNSKLMQRKGEWWVVNKMQHELGGGRVYTSPTAFTNYVEDLISFTDVTRGAMRTIAPVAGGVGVFQEYGGGKLIPDNYNFKNGLTGWTNYNGFTASTNNRRVLGYTQSGSIFTPIYDDTGTSEPYLVNRNVSPLWVLFPIPGISTFDPYAIRSTRIVSPVVSGDSSRAKAAIEINAVGRNGTYLPFSVVLKRPGRKNLFLNRDNEWQSREIAQLLSFKNEGADNLAAVSAGMSVSVVISAESSGETLDDVGTYTIEVLIFGSGLQGDNTVDNTTLINSASVQFSAASNDTPKGTLYKADQGGESYTKIHDTETTIFGDYLTGGLNGYFYNYAPDDTSSLLAPNGSRSQPAWVNTYTQNTEPLPLLQQTIRQMRRMFSVAHDFIKGEIDVAYFDPLSVFEDCERRFVIVEAEFDFLRGSLQVVLEEVAYQNLTVREYIYSYFGEGDEGIRGISGISAGSSGGGGGGGGMAPEPSWLENEITIDPESGLLSVDGWHVKGDLIIEGQVNQWLAQQLVVDDARIQVNRRQGGATVDSGLVIYNKDTSTEVSSLVYDVNGIWRAGGQRIYTDAYKPLADNATNLGGYSAASYPRKAENAVITGAWNFRRTGSLGGSLGDSFLLHEIGAGGGTANNVYQRKWAYRRSAGSDWQTWVLHDGISIDTVYATPRNSTRTWYERSPSQALHMWGSSANEQMRLSSTGLYIGNSAGINAAERLHVAGNGLFEGNLIAQGNLSAVNAALSGTLGVAGASTFGGNVGTSNFASQALGWRVTPQGQADFRHIYTDELQAKAFTADISQALVGSDVLTKSVAKLAQNFTVTTNGTTAPLYVEELEGFAGMQVFAVNDILLIRIFDRSGGGLLIKNVWVEVVSYVGTTNNVQQFTVNVINSGGVAGLMAYAGSVILDYGTSGSGVIERTVLDAMGSPYSQVKTWVNDPSNPANYTIHNRTGNLDGIANASGFGFYGENTFLTGKLLVGDLTKAGQFMEYENGQLNIKGQITVTGGNAATKADVDAVQVGGRNLLKLSDYSTVPDIIRFNNVHIKPNSTYTLSDYNGIFERGQVAILNSEGSNLFVIWDWGSTYKRITFTTPGSIIEGDYVIRFWKGGGGNAFEASDKTIKLEIGNRATDWTPAPEDVDAGIASAKQEALTAAGNAQSTANSANTAVGNLGDYVDGAFKDGVIDTAEAKAIEKYKNNLSETKLSVDGSYTKLYNNAYLTGTPKSNLLAAKTALNTAYTNLINSINTAIADGKTTAAEKSDVDSKFGLFNTALATYSVRVEEANAAIQIAVEGAANGYTDAGVAAAEASTSALATRVETTLGLADLEGIDQTLITGNKVRTSLLEVTDIVAQGITAGHVEGLTLNFDKGKVGGFTITDNLIAAGSWDPEYSAGSGIKMDASGRSFMAQYNNPSNVVSMRYLSPSKWGLIGMVNENIVFQLGSTNEIAGITFDDSKLSTENWELNKDGSAKFAGGLINMLADGDTTIGDVHVDSGGSLVVKEGTDNRVLITKDNISTLAAIASSTQNTTENNSVLTTYPNVGLATIAQPKAITVNNNGTRLTVTGTFGLDLSTPAGEQRYSQADLSARVYLRKVGDGWGAGVLLSSGSVTVNKLTGEAMSDFFSNKSLNKVVTVAAGQYRIVADYNFIVDGPGPNEWSYYSALLRINDTSMHALYDGAYQRNEIGKNGIGVITNANNYSFFGKEGGTYRAVEKVSNATMYDKPGVLFAGNIASGGGLTAGYWGAKYRAGSYREGDNIYRIHHNVGHLNYYVYLTPHSDARMWVLSKETTYVRVQASLASLSFDFAITGNNQ